MESTKIKRLFCASAPPLAAVLVTFGLFMLLNLLYGIFPCGSNTIVWCDMEQQAVPLLMQFKRIMQSGETIAFSQLDAGGMRFYAVFFFFLSNPLSLLTLLTDIPANMLIVLLVIAKLALSAGTAAAWMRFRIRDISAPLQILLGVMYGCCGYGLFYYQNLMWLDIMAIMPLLMISMRLLLKKAKTLPYILSLSAAMIMCFYLGYMLVLFILIYMAVSLRITVPKERRGKVAGRFILSSLLAACLTAFVWLPSFIQVMQSARTTSVMNTLMNAYLFNHLGDKVNVIGCTCLCYAALIPLWMRGTKNTVSRRRDRGLCILLGLAAILDPINIMWHAGSYQAFPLRWGMIPILLLLTLAGRQLTEADRSGHPEKNRFRSAALLTGMAVIAAGVGLLLHFALQNGLYSYIKTLWVDVGAALRMLMMIAAMTLAYALLLLLRRRGEISRRFAMVFLCIMFFGEFVFQYDVYFGKAANPDTLFDQTIEAADAVQPEDSTARVRMTKKYAHANMIGAVGCPTLAHYTSLTREDFLYGVKRLGYSSYWMEVNSIGGTVLSDALWNVQYQLGQPFEFPSWTKPVFTGEKLSMVQSELTVPPVLYCDAEPDAIAELPRGSRIAVQQYLAKQMLGTPDLITVYQPTEFHNVELQTEPDGTIRCKRTNSDQDAEIRFSVFVPSHQALYFDLYSQRGTELQTPQNGAVNVQINDHEAALSYPENNNNGFVFLGEPNGSYAVINVKVLNDFECESFGVFGIDLARTAEAMNKVRGAALQYKKGVYTTECETDTPKTLLLSAAYDEGFSAEVNGEPTEVYRVNSCQIGVRVPKGKSTVQVRFSVQGLRPGLLLGGIGLAAAIVFLLLRKKLPERITAAFRHGAAIFVQATYWIIIAVVYVFPLTMQVCGPIASIFS
ncbi:MAG: YfhO family protein [Oscillospiraceae bacterium]|nr:YfhO family protein [Oscillospiraceae bacterium]